VKGKPQIMHIMAFFVQPSKVKRSSGVLCLCRVIQEVRVAARTTLLIGCHVLRPAIRAFSSGIRQLAFRVFGGGLRSHIINSFLTAPKE